MRTTHVADNPAPNSDGTDPYSPPARRRPGIYHTVIAADGTRLAVYEYGTRDANQTVLLSHGWCLNRRCWTRQIARLRRRWGQEVRILAIEHRGHGDSDSAPMSTYTPAQLAADIADVLTALHVTGRLVMVGHSMGAMALISYLERPPEQQPVAPAGLVLIATAAGNLTEYGLGRLLATPLVDLVVDLVGHVPDHALRVLARPLCAALSRRIGCGINERATLAALCTDALASTPLRTAVGYLPALRDFNQLHTLPSIHAATTVISGADDVLTPPSHGYEIAARIAGAVHLNLPRAGHMIPLQFPGVITDAINALLRPGATGAAVIGA